jgi:hypothetical protein
MDLATVVQNLGARADKQWTSVGVVVADNGASAVTFNDANGNPLPQGYLVTVKLMPSGVTVACRVSSQVAGNGEADFYPFVANDEVQVIVNEGNERANCVIIGRLNQSFDVHPTSVAGQDSTSNTFGFRRIIAPYILECGNSYLIRNALTGAFFSIDKTGAITATNGDMHYLAIGHDFVGLVLGDNSAVMQLLPATSQVFLQANGTQLLLDNDASQFLTTGTLALATSGIGTTGHAITAEQVLMLIQASITPLGAAIVAAFTTVMPTTPLTGANGAALAATLAILLAPAAPTLLVGAVSAAAALPIAPPLSAALLAALNIPGDPTGAIPGVGKVGLLF